MQIEIVESLLNITKPRWNSWIPDDYPFLQHEFLVGLESSGCTTADSGCSRFISRFITKVIWFDYALLSENSLMENTFSIGPARQQRSGLSYYPKLLSIPFTPATGPRLQAESMIAERFGALF